MVGMETLRCPTCVTLLPDPDARRCPACHTKLRKRGRPIVLGESNRLSGRSLPVDVELRVRAEARYETYEPRTKPDEPVEALFAFAPSETVEPPPPSRPEPLDFERLDGAAVERTPAAEPLAAAIEYPTRGPAPERERELPPVVALDPEVADPEVADPEVIEPAPIPAHIDLTEAREPVAAAIDLTSDPEPAPEPAVRRLSGWQAVPPRGAPSPLDGTLNEMVEELHRRARADAGKPRTR